MTDNQERALLDRYTALQNDVCEGRMPGGFVWDSDAEDYELYYPGRNNRNGNDRQSTRLADLDAVVAFVDAVEADRVLEDGALWGADWEAPE